MTENGGEKMITAEPTPMPELPAFVKDMGHVTLAIVCIALGIVLVLLLVRRR